MKSAKREAFHKRIMRE